MKRILFPILMIFTIVLTACGPQSTSTPISSTSSDLAVETQLAVGTLKLNGTDQDISAKQAAELVVYWQVYKELSQSETAAQAEIDGLIAQIQETMTDGQMQAITDMDITQQDVLASMQGVVIPSSNAGDSKVSVPSGGGMPGGGPGDGGGAPPDGGMPADMDGAAPAASTDQSQSAQAASGTAASAGVPTALVQAVIQSLQQKIAA